MIPSTEFAKTVQRELSEDEWLATVLARHAEDIAYDPSILVSLPLSVVLALRAVAVRSLENHPKEVPHALS